MIRRSAGLGRHNLITDLEVVSKPRSCTGEVANEDGTNAEIHVRRGSC
jgi:hypothetical protein